MTWIPFSSQTTVSGSRIKWESWPKSRQWCFKWLLDSKKEEERISNAKLFFFFFKQISKDHCILNSSWDRPLLYMCHLRVFIFKNEWQNIIFKYIYLLLYWIMIRTGRKGKKKSPPWVWGHFSTGLTSTCPPYCGQKSSSWNVYLALSHSCLQPWMVLPSL